MAQRELRWQRTVGTVTATTDDGIHWTWKVGGAEYLYDDVRNELSMKDASVPAKTGFDSLGSAIGWTVGYSEAVANISRRGNGRQNEQSR